MNDPNSPFHFFGIRHHGPGSARSLLAALRRLQPDLLLMEARRKPRPSCRWRATRR